MGVGLEAGLAIDSMADVLGELLDQADEAALRDDGEELAVAKVCVAIGVAAGTTERALARDFDGEHRRFAA